MYEDEMLMYKENLDRIKKEATDNTTGEVVDYWNARDLMRCLGYKQWRKFEGAINRAKLSCQQAGYNPNDHFQDITKTYKAGQGAQREINDYNLSRYACDIIAMNADPRKNEVSFAQGYFSCQTNELEEIKEQMDTNNRLQKRQELSAQEKEFSANMVKHGVPRRDIPVIRSEGDKALFGGLSTKEMKNRVGCPENRPLNDFTDPAIVTGKAFATELTNLLIRLNNLHGTEEIGATHVRNNMAVRNTIVETIGIAPEDLPPRDDIKKVQRADNTKKKGIAKIGKLPNCIE